MSRHKITWMRPCGEDDIEYDVTFEHRRGRPAVWTLRNGDPGYPAEPDEFEAIDIKPAAGTLSACEKAYLLDQAQQWLDGEGCEEASEIVVANDERAREYAAELRLAP